MEAIVTEGLTKYYGKATGFKRYLSLKVDSGHCVGFLGPNAVGKSRQSEFRVSLIWHTEGKAYISGHDVIGESTKASQQHKSQAQRSLYNM